jgi:hypothetical protein
MLLTRCFAMATVTHTLFDTLTGMVDFESHPI